MSFSVDVKREIAQKKCQKDCCRRAACYGAACFAKYFDSNGLVVQSEQRFIVHYIAKLFQSCGIAGETVEKERANGKLYEFAIKAPEQVQKLAEFLQADYSEPNLRINAELLKCPDCNNAFIRSAFLCSGSITDPEKEYNLEFKTGKRLLAYDFEGLLSELNFGPGRTERKGTNVVYLKASNHIEDMLTYMGAFNASMEVMNKKAYKLTVNQVNRRTNCDTANLNKTASSNAEVLKAIRYLKEQHLLEVQTPALQEAAYMRLKYPDESLAELAALFNPPISKSGLSHRLKKIVAVSAQLQAHTKAKGV